MKEIEIKKLRKKREKHFLQEDGNIIAKVYGENIHFKKNGKYEEIDNTLVKQGNYYTNKENEYKVYFSESTKNGLMRFESSNHYVNIYTINSNETKLDKKASNSKLNEVVLYKNIFNNVDLEYIVMPTQVKENIILKTKDSDIDKICFCIETDVELILNTNKTISAVKENKTIFTFEAPYMVDCNNTVCNDVFYELTRINDQYMLNMNLNKEWLNDSNRCYPILIDPTITNTGSDSSIKDTYIYPGDTGVDKNSQDILKAGVERINGNDIVNRTLVWFDLPTIATGSQIIEASVNLIGYPSIGDNWDESDIVTIHRITQDWTEETANWQTMNDKFDSRIEGAFNSVRSFATSDGYFSSNLNFADITNLVKKWYSSESNYGIMLKMNEENYRSDIIPAFFSNNNTVEGYNPKPFLSITYRNQNGLEDYMDYTSQFFEGGLSHINNYNGNLTTVFNVGSTVGGKMPISLNLIYNTNDVILENNFGFGIGYKLDLYQTIKELPIEENIYLEYIDGDGTIHYFYQEEGSEIFKDEDGLDLTIEKINDNYILSDKTGNQMKFVIKNTVGYLTELIDIEENKIIITYDSNDYIVQIKDANDSTINLTYENDKIIIENPDNIVNLNLENNKIINITKYSGSVIFTYNNNGIITSITDESSKKIVYEYYDQIPYRVKKVSEYGLNNNLGNYFNVLYDFNSTTIIDNKNRATTMTFNNYGNLASKSNLKHKDDINNAYGIISNYGEHSYGESSIKNKLLEAVIPLKYVKNYLKNTSFEDDNINFTPSTDVTAILSTEYAETGFKSLKLVSTSLEQSLYQSIIVPKGKYYTFSAYIKNNNNVRLSLNYIDVNNQLVESISQTISENDEFYRYDVTINYPEDATSELFIKIYLDTMGTTYIDDIQLEEGEVANNYNMIENSDFSEGLVGWNLESYNGEEALSTNDKYEIVNINDDLKALRVKMNPSYDNIFDKEFNACGKEGDIYTISFWYKNEGFVSQDGIGAQILNNVTIMYNPVDENHGMGVELSKGFNPNDNTWQYFSQSFVAPYDFRSLTIRFLQLYNANNFYITNMSLFKDIRSVGYNYDEAGNLTASIELNNSSTNYNYNKNNQLIKSTNPKGKHMTYEYDNLVTDRVLSVVSDNGICNSVKYDEFGNPIKTKISKTRIKDIVSGFYKIRVKGTNKYLTDLNGNIMFKEDECGHSTLFVQKNNDYYRIRNSIILNRYLKEENNSIILSSDNSLFEFIKKDDESYLIKLKDYEKYLKCDNNNLILSDYEYDNPDSSFFIEIQEGNFIENTAEYTEDGKFIKSSTDTLFNKTLYDINSITGLTNSITNAKGSVTNYTYDDKRRLVKIKQNEKEIDYVYNSHNVLSKIIQGNKEYNFVYDDFLNTKQIKIGENIDLITNNYEENNGNLISSTFGNNHTISYTYDDYDRLKTNVKMDDIYNYKYNNNGDLVKIIANNDVYKYTYDTAKRLREARFNNFKVKYTYDVNGNLINTKYNLDNFNHEITNEYDDDDAIIKTTFDNNEVTYSYDDLGRLEYINKMGMPLKYKYVSNGRRTSLLIKEFNDLSYKYDKMNNITHIYDNGILKNKYYYDEYNQLIKEKNYKTKETIKYEYDNSGNILSKTIYDLNLHNLLSIDKYEYSNFNWEDQMTKFNEQEITYDSIGNPLTIGNEISLSWINGRQLNRYEDSNNTISYKYNND